MTRSKTLIRAAVTLSLGVVGAPWSGSSVVRGQEMSAAKPSVAEPAPRATAVSGQVSLGGRSRIVLEPGDETVQVYYLLDITNAASTPVNPPTLFVFDLPAGAVGTTLLDGSSPQANVTGTRVRVQGPFAPGATLVQVAAELPVSNGTLQMTQLFPVVFDQLSVVARKVGGSSLSSLQLPTQREMGTDGEAYVAASGPAVAAGQPIVLVLTGLPHHSAAPRWIALSLAIGILVIGVWASRRTDGPATTGERRALIAQREKLFADLVKLETDRRNGRGDPARYGPRREAFVGSLERLYGALDGDVAGSDAAGGTGVTA
jgi:hypothetical protein